MHENIESDFQNNQITQTNISTIAFPRSWGYD